MVDCCCLFPEKGTQNWKFDVSIVVGKRHDTIHFLHVFSLEKKGMKHLDHKDHGIFIYIMHGYTQ